MAISYDKLFKLLKDKGWTTYKIRQEKLIGQGTLTALKNKTGGLDSKTMSRICEVLNCQPGDIMEYIPDYEIIEITEEERYGLILRYVGEGWKIDGYSGIYPTFIKAEKAAEKIAREQ